jgi:hypothetical protein
MQFFPLRDTENSVYPYVNIYAQKGAIPGTKAGQNLHHEEVTILLLIGVSVTIVMALIAWVCIKLKDRNKS